MADVRRLARWLTAVALGVSAVSAVFRLLALRPDVAAALSARRPVLFPGYPRLLPIVDTDAEANLPTWFSSCLLLLAALLMWGLSRSARESGRPWRRHWGFLALVFVFLSLDEVAQLHDLGQAVVSPVVETHGVLHFGWVVLAIPLVAGLGLAYLPFLRGLPTRTRRCIALAGVLYVGGALGMEIVGGWLVDDAGGMSTVAYVLATTVEELLEMLGVTLFVYALGSLAGPPARPAQAVSQPASSAPQGRPASG